ncbi:uncharacterized protein LOC143263784 [Megalopta genalis]|uniref:uncharacterized protein LOC143263784 n=1 Tax=Megalopta genalis TaxID=115081 RepID=UPI003FD3EB80
MIPTLQNLVWGYVINLYLNDQFPLEWKTATERLMRKDFTSRVSLDHRFSSRVGSGLYGNVGARASTLRWENIESAFKNRISTGVVINVEHVDPRHFLQHAKRIVTNRITELLNVHLSLKVNVVLEAEFVLRDEVSVKSFSTRNVALFHSSNLRRWYAKDVVPTLLTSIEEFQERDSGWALSKILHLMVNSNKYQPLQAGCQVSVPRTVQLKKAVLNVYSDDDNACFYWAVVASLYPAKNNLNRTSSYPHYSDVLHTEGFQLPMLFKDIPKFEKANDVSVNVFEWGGEQERCRTLHLTSRKREKHVNLLLIHDYENLRNHYLCIRNLSRLVSSQISTQHNKHICDR